MSLLDRIKYGYLAYFSRPAADRLIYRTLRRLQPRSIVQIGLGNAERAVKALRFAVREQPAGVAFTAIDLFETSPAGRTALGLKAAHQLLSTTSAKIRLVPGDPFSALARMANNLIGTDLVLIAADQHGESLDRAWFYVPRMLTDASLVLVEEPAADGQTQFCTLTKAEIAARAGHDARRRAA